MLKLIVILGGGALMALEMVGSRVLAPHFGSSIFVWGSLISIFLTALSIGNYLGGALADRRPRISGLGAMMVVPGVWIWLLPFFANAVNDWVARLSLGPRLSPLAASIILFALPSVFLGTLSPYAIRLEARTIESVGNTAGRLYALSTAGSIVGTLAASFFLIPSIGVRNILHLLGIILVLLAALALASAYVTDRRVPETGTEKGATKGTAKGRGTGQGQKRTGERKSRSGAAPPVALGIVLVLMLASTDWASSTPGVVYETDSLYHRIIVRDQERLRILHFDNSYQSGMHLDRPDDLVFEYTRYLHLPRVFAPQGTKALFVGLGGGSVPKSYLQHYPDITIEAVEIDPQVVYVAREFFGLPEADNLRVHAQDGRLFVKQSDAVYDIIMLDAYFSESIPFHLTTREFLEEVKARLAPEGVVAANIIGAIGGSQSKLFRAMLRTYQEVFPQVYVFSVGPSRGVSDPFVRNIIVIATASSERLSRRELELRAADMRNRGLLGIDVAPYLSNLIEGNILVDDVPVLTDDYAPVDSLQHF